MKCYTVCTKIPLSVYEALVRESELSGFSIGAIVRQLVILGLELPEYEADKIVCSKVDGRRTGKQENSVKSS